MDIIIQDIKNKLENSFQIVRYSSKSEDLHEIFWFTPPNYSWTNSKGKDVDYRNGTGAFGYVLCQTNNAYEVQLRYGTNGKWLGTDLYKEFVNNEKVEKHNINMQALETICRDIYGWNVNKYTPARVNKEALQIVVAITQNENAEQFVECIKQWNSKNFEKFIKLKDKVLGYINNGMTKEQIIMATTMEEWWNIIRQKKNLILQGAPGTGKTYSTAELALEIINRQKENSNSNSTQQTSSKRAEIMGKYNGLLIKKFVKYEDVTKKTGDVTVEKKFGEIADDNQIAFVTFHQSMDYEDFIEGIKPVSVGDNVHYPVKSGIFKAIVNKAKENPAKNYILIIDEINRGNVSKIFGELITLLEADKRTCWKLKSEELPKEQDKSKENQHTTDKPKEVEEDCVKNPNAIKVVLPYSQEEFSVPSNLYIIGTMNTTDRSAGSLDYAIRRRFAFVTLESSDAEISEGEPKELCKAVKSFIKNNKTDSEMDFADLMVGHSYFMKPQNGDDNWLQMKWKYEILPLLKEYHKDGLLNKAPKPDIGSFIKDNPSEHT